MIELKKYLKMWSVWVLSLIPIVEILADILPQLQAVLPSGWYAWVAVVALFVRGLKQAGLIEEKSSDNGVDR